MVDALHHDFGVNLKILVVSNHWSKANNVTFGGVWADRQIHALRERGVTVETFDIGTSHSPLHLWRKVMHLRRVVKEVRPDLVHARYGTVVALVSVLSGCDTVITFAGSDLLRGAGISLGRTCFGILLSNVASLTARAVVCVSEEMRQALWWRTRNAVVIPDGVQIEKFEPMDREEARRRLGWNGLHPVVIIDAARDPIGKGLELAEAAFKIVRQRVPDVELKVLCGVQPDEMPLYCNAADVLLCASRQEGSPNIVKEAMACNLPVVSTPVGDVRELLAGVCPSVVVPRTADSLACGLIEVLSQGGRSNGRAHVQHLSINNVAARVIAVYEAVEDGLQSRSRPAPGRNFLERVKLSLSLEYRLGLQTSGKL